MKPARLAVMSLLLGLAAVPALGQHIYKYRMPDGSILYTDSRSGFTDQYVKGKLEETFTEPPPSPASVDATMGARNEARARNATEVAKARGQGVDAAYQVMIQAQQQLDQAEQALQAGLEPLPGERLGTVSGASRLAPEYWDRINGLRQAVEDARDRVDRATQAWIQARE